MITMLTTGHRFQRIIAIVGIAILMGSTLCAQAQEQKGIVKTRGRMVNGQLVRGEWDSGCSRSVCRSKCSVQEIRRRFFNPCSRAEISRQKRLEIVYKGRVMF